MLAKAAVEGKLDTRADASKHTGDFQKIVTGVNETLDAVIGPINELMGCLEEMAKKNLTVSVKGNYQGDLENMKNVMNKTLESLNDILGNVITTVNQVTSGAQQVSDSSQSLSQGSTEQASSVEEVTASMTEMASQTKQNAENATQANQLATAAHDKANQGNTQMQQMLGAMKEINESSGKIAKIIKVIDEIAFQTNLLALNAAVEAARAGVHGKGFAVVADEVRNLAQRSALAAKETTELIENSIKKVENGTNISNETAKALGEIVAGIAKASDLVGEIASASNEQAQGIGQVNAALSQIDQVTQSNTANAEESAAASEELSGQAINLQKMLSEFELSGNGNGRGISDISVRKELKPLELDHKVKGGNGSKKKTKEHIGIRPAVAIALDDSEFGKY
jgi:methyl-accepting chemotaxis protein